MTSSRGRLTAGRVFVGAQVALSLVLLVAAGLFLRTLINLQNFDLGYSKDHLAMLSVDASAAGYSNQARGLLFRNLQDKLRTVPGVKSVTYSMNGLFSGSESGDAVLVEGYTPTGKNDRSSRFDAVGPSYFSALGIPLCRYLCCVRHDCPRDCWDYRLRTGRRAGRRLFSDPLSGKQIIRSHSDRSRCYCLRSGNPLAGRLDRRHTARCEPRASIQPSLCATSNCYSSVIIKEWQLRK